ncbi:MAG TPA: M50 family metallopeptidase [Myxococcota bacterium]|nr:M50 family metallopeptidase [Myxococcota bacterium]
MNAGVRNALIASAALTLVAEYVPYANVPGRPLVWMSTLAHEMGHGVAAMLVGAQFHALQLHADGSGVAHWSGAPGPFARAFIAAGGLIGPAVAAAGCFLLTRSAKLSRLGLGLTAILLGLACLLVVRNLFGLLFVGCLALALGAAARWLHEEAARVLVAFLGVQLSISVFTRSDYLFSNVAKTANGVMPSDTAHMAQALWLPSWFWGIVCGLVSLGVLAGGVWGALKER